MYQYVLNVLINMGEGNNMNILNYILDKFCPCLTHKNMRVDELTTQDIKDIKQSLKDFEDGNFYTLEDIKRMFGLK